MRFRIFCLLTVLAALLGLAGCGAANEPTSREESLFELAVEDEDSAEESFAEDEGMSETAAESEEETAEVESEYVEYWFRTKKLRDQHYEKHGVEMGFDSADDYRRAASDVVNAPDALHKIEKEDGDDVYYLEETNEFVVVSADGYLRTYFKPDKGKAYYDKQ